MLVSLWNSRAGRTRWLPHVAALQPKVAYAKGGEVDIAKGQQADSNLKTTIDFFHDGLLPEEDKIAQVWICHSPSTHYWMMCCIMWREMELYIQM